MTQLPNNHIGVQVPEGSDKFVLVASTFYSPSFLYLQGFDKTIDLPPGKYSIVGLAIDLTEEDWYNIVEKGDSQHVDLFTHYNSVPEMWLFTATESGYSLLESKGLKKETTLILKQQL
jgi:hypothetical protein